MEHHFMANIKYLRDQRKLKQSDLSSLLGLRQSTWSGYEKGTFYPKFNDLLLISDFFNISLDNLIFSNLSGKEKPKRNAGAEQSANTHSFLLLSVKDEMIDQLKANLDTKDAIITSKEETIGLLRQILESKDDEIKKLNYEIDEIKKTVDSRRINDQELASR